LQTYFSEMLSKLKRTRSQKMFDLYILSWQSSYDVMFFMCESRQQHFTEFVFV